LKFGISDYRYLITEAIKKLTIFGIASRQQRMVQKQLETCIWIRLGRLFFEKDFSLKETQSMKCT